MTYDDILKSRKPTVIMFYGPACAPCARLKPRLGELQKKLGFSLEMINVASEMKQVLAMGIKGVPTLVAVKNGKAEVMFTGELPDAQIAVKLHEKGMLP